MASCKDVAHVYVCRVNAWQTISRFGAFCEIRGVRLCDIQESETAVVIVDRHVNPQQNHIWQLGPLGEGWSYLHGATRGTPPITDVSGGGFRGGRRRNDLSFNSAALSRESAAVALIPNSQSRTAGPGC